VNVANDVADTSVQGWTKARGTKKAAVINDRTQTQCFAPPPVHRNKLQKISQKYIRIIQKL
jgi:hypothetical protein